ncbi:MAG: hypothetical protein IIZ08_06515 [Clostridia bacterium]|nr:hypothetical protein [Clostridia bacterium]
MRKTIKAVIAAVAACAMLTSLAACDFLYFLRGDSLMEGIYEKLTANEDYAEWKAQFTGTTFGEKLDGKSIVIKAKGDEGINGEYVFTHEGDYITYKPSNGEEYSGYAVFMNIRNAVADYYGMNSTLMNGYIAGLNFIGAKNKYLVIDFENLDFRIYAAKKWEMKELDKMFVNEKALEYTDALTDEYKNGYINSGRITAAMFGNRGKFELIVGEYGKSNTELTYNSIMNIVAKLQPDGYKSFANDYTELKDAKGRGYKVTVGLDSNVAAEHEFTAEEGYSYVTVTF